jgi:hypothetical protein
MIIKLKIASVILCLLLCCNPKGGKSQVAVSDSLALVEFYWASNGPTWTNDSNWLTGPVISWFGVLTDISTALTPPFRVLTVSLCYNNLNGILSPLICNVTKLRTLSVCGNNLTGQLPTNIGFLSDLIVLNASDCHFTNPIPISLGSSLTNNLHNLNLGGNEFSGHFPDTILHNKRLSSLNITFNHYSSIKCYYQEMKLLNPNYLSGLIELNNNNFTFDDLIPYKQLNLPPDNLFIAPQDSVLSGLDTTIVAGSSFTMDSWVDTCSTNRYTWYKNGNWLNWASTNSSWTITNAQSANSGYYTCAITNPAQCSILTLWRKTIHVTVGPTPGINEYSTDNPFCKIIYHLQSQMLDVTFNLPANEKVVCNLYDETGRKILRLYEGIVSHQELHHYLGWMKKGLYIVKAETLHNVITKKVIVY